MSRQQQQQQQFRHGTDMNPEMIKPKADVSDLWIQHQRRKTKTTQSWACIYCPERKIFHSEIDLWNHAEKDHQDEIPSNQDELKQFRKSYESKSALKRPTRDEYSPRKSSNNEASAAQADPQPPQLQTKRPLNAPQPSRSLSGLQALNLRPNEDITMEDEEITTDQPRKRAAVGDGISAGSASPFREASDSPPPRRSLARPTSGPTSTSDTETRRQATKGQLWTPDQDSPFTRSSFDPSNIASIQASKSRAQGFKPANRRPTKTSPPQTTPRSAPQAIQQHHHHHHAPANYPSAILPNRTTSETESRSQNVPYSIILQPETRPISQEQLVAEVKGIYAGLVMVEAKCIEVDNKQATLAQGDPPTQPKLNNEQWQALIALHRTLLHEHHDFFLASQHPSASPALRRLASKYAMPARMWRHGIHSFLELLRHRLPASLDHMLAFIYLAYSMMALLYETVPAFEDTWIECLGDLGRYRMAIEDDDIRDRDVWTGVARHWYSKASDKAPTTGRLYHHLAILARPNALQQLYYYAKSLCVLVPFTSARESILTLFDPVLNAENGQGQYRLPPLDTAFIRAHGHLFTNRNMERFEPAVKEFLGLLDTQIGRVTKKFMEQGCHIAVSNNVAMLGFASKENPLMKAIGSSSGDETADVDMDSAQDDISPSMIAFKYAQNLSNSALEIVLQRIGDPNVLPFIHVSLVFMFRMSQFSGAMDILVPTFPWQSLAIMLNTLLKSYKTFSRIEDKKFPLPEKDDVRPFPEDFGMRGLLWAEKYFPARWFLNEKSDEEEKYHELPSMLDQRKERILWLACRVADAGPWINFDSSKPEFSVQSNDTDVESLTFAPATTDDTVTRAETWLSVETYPNAEEDMSSVTMTAADTPPHE
ncbi:hypothetical protein SBOR_5038 [Sclerotinia borealis F-4128]|uniref:Nonsense-mediated mRNA decay factor n=1 Tax=Sclerotinia borealis (strain F-4128) TaxID=1432307 RepID=W9CF69_SCLBF|nr:hypothetical protein SBOR_5038 [Sclerotinia borealis F-4128]